MAGTMALVVAVEFLEAASEAEPSVGDRTAGLPAVRRKVREVARPSGTAGAVDASNLASVAVLVGSGALAAAAGITLPAIAPPLERQPSQLGGKVNRT
jgi:hypothetical protein